MNFLDEISFQALAQAVREDAEDFGNCPICGMPLHKELSFCSRCDSDMCEACVERHMEEGEGDGRD